MNEQAAVRAANARRTCPWGELSVLAGIWLALAAYAVPRLAIPVAASLMGAGDNFADVGDSFQKLAVVAEYADERLAALASNRSLPGPPQVLGDPVTARIAWVFAIISGALFAAVAIIASRLRPRAFARALGLESYDFDRAWVAGAWVVGMYLLVGAYGVVGKALGLEGIEAPASAFAPTLRDPVALALYGAVTLIAAPLAEELFYRGLIFGGLSSWGFWPAAIVSSSLFAFSHLSAATFLPVFAIGVVMAWLFWWRGSLWDAILFHFLFNLLSFILLIARS